MGKIAYLFAGQGAQYPGMGQDLYEAFPAARVIFDRCEELHPGLLDLCFHGTKEELAITKNTQPALFAMDLACFAAVGRPCDMCAGFSLGETVALAVSGMMTADTAFRYVCKRGAYMHACAEANPGAMVAVLRLTPDVVESLCAEFSAVYPVNYNCPGQIAVAGSAAEIDAFSERVAQSGGRAMRLAVSGAFHSPFMADAAQKLSAELEQCEVKTPELPIYSNVTGQPYTCADRALISAQVKSPVRWEDTIRAMIRDGADTFVELGPGKTLSGLVKKISGDVAVYNVQSCADVANYLEGKDAK